MTRVRDESFMQAFAVVLRAVRLERGFSQEQLAARASVDRTFVGKLESGRHQPSLAVVFKLADAIGLPPEELVRMVRQRPAELPSQGSLRRTKKAPARAA
jgi:transcriptional regulator with XRE-family HTH domain